MLSRFFKIGVREHERDISHEDYKALFTSDLGRRVLADMIEFSQLVKVQPDDHLANEHLQRLEGRREIVSKILQALGHRDLPNSIVEQAIEETEYVRDPDTAIYTDGAEPGYYEHGDD